jgi:glycosyltransferase involved in cell wall biosynthesis
LASDISSIRNVLDESNSFLSPPDDILKWKENLQKIVENYDDAKKKANNAYEKFINNYTWKKRAENILKNIEINT